MALNAGNFWKNIEGFGLFLYFHSIIFVVNYKMNIISSHKMFIISPSVTRAAVRGWFWVLGCSSDMSGCIHWDWYWYPGDCLRISATSVAILRATSVTELQLRPRTTVNCDLWLPFASLIDSLPKDDILVFAFGDVEKLPNNRICITLVLYNLLTITQIEEMTWKLHILNLFYIKK